MEWISLDEPVLVLHEEGSDDLHPANIINDM